MRGRAGSTQCGPGTATSEVSGPRKQRMEEVGDHKGHSQPRGRGAGGTQVSPLLPGRLASVILTARFFSSPTSCPSPASLPSCPHTSPARREEGRGGLQSPCCSGPGRTLQHPYPPSGPSQQGCGRCWGHPSSQGLVTRPPGGSQAREPAVSEQSPSGLLTPLAHGILTTTLRKPC